MSSLFGNFTDDPKIQRQALASRYSAARMNLLLFIIFSAVNTVLLAAGTNLYFLFSASIPYLIVKIAKLYCGLLPAEYYGEEYAEMVFADKSFFAVSIVIAFLVLAIYFICWLFSKKYNVRWLTIGLVLVIFDTLILLLNSGIGSIVDLLLHICMIVILYMGISAHSKMRALPKEQPIIEGEFSEMEDGGDTYDEEGDLNVLSEGIEAIEDGDSENK